MKRQTTYLDAKLFAEYLGKPLLGPNIKITAVAPANRMVEGSLSFQNSFDQYQLKYLNTKNNSLLIANNEYDGKLLIPHIISSDPKKDFCILANKFFPPIERISKVETTAIVNTGAELGDNVYVGHNCVIEKNVKIGSNTIISNNVVISKNAQVGENCLIKSGTIVGEKGFGFVRSEGQSPISFPHYGTVIIGNNVEIGALNTIAAGALQNTIIGDNVKTDDQVHIAHNVKIGKNTCIASQANILGSVSIGQNAYIGGRAVIRDGIELGRDSFVGMGAVVVKSFGRNITLIGNPARPFINSNRSLLRHDT